MFWCCHHESGVVWVNLADSVGIPRLSRCSIETTDLGFLAYVRYCVLHVWTAFWNSNPRPAFQPVKDHNASTLGRFEAPKLTMIFATM